MCNIHRSVSPKPNIVKRDGDKRILVNGKKLKLFLAELMRTYILKLYFNCDLRIYVNQIWSCMFYVPNLYNIEIEKI